MATSLTGPWVVERALPAAPVPRPPQPTRATWIVLFSAAWTDGIATPASAEPAAARPVGSRDVGRVLPGFGSVMVSTPWEGGGIGRQDLRAGLAFRQGVNRCASST